MTTTTEPTAPARARRRAAGRCTFELRSLERLDATRGTAVVRIGGALSTPGSTKPPILYLQAAQPSVLRPAWATPAGDSWAAEYAAAAAQLSEPGAALLLVLPDGRLVDLPQLPPAPAPVPARRRPRPSKRVIGAGLAAVASIAAAVWLASLAMRDDEPPRPAPSRPALADAPNRAAAPTAGLAPREALASTPSGMRLVAEAVRRRIGLYRSPTATRAWTFLRNPNSMGAPAVLLVESASDDRFEVALPIRPNGRTAWVRAADVRLSRVDYRVDVDLTRHRVTVRRGDRVVVRSAAGVGRSLTPTPSGTYYVTALLKQPDPTGIYGPYAFALSGHSTVLDEFAGGNGRIGLHGTNNPSGIGSDVSHGCIRVPNAVIRRLARMLPLGTPVRISR
jgi:lipoprotein-anchoring transpeptidase ErfK/SrfK